MNSTRLTSAVYYDSNSSSCEKLLTVWMVRPPQTAEVYLLDIPRIIFENKVRERKCLDKYFVYISARLIKYQVQNSKFEKESARDYRVFSNLNCCDLNVGKLLRFILCAQSSVRCSLTINKLRGYATVRRLKWHQTLRIFFYETMNVTISSLLFMVRAYVKGHIV